MGEQTSTSPAETKTSLAETKTSLAETKTSLAEIEAEIAATRARLATTIDELVIRAQPREIARRQAASAKSRFIEATHTPEGDLRVERVGAMAAGSAVLLGLAILHHRHHRRRG